ncbi:MAG: hypothetical protein OES09_15790, partial [Gammaproteobacteria bacterium]|nr:hypothetical protein [Gammaproteobacteria bacterium]
MKPKVRNGMRGRYTHILVAAAVLLTPMELVTAHEPHPVAMHELDWSAEQIKRVNSMAMDFQSGELVISWTLPGRVETVAGRSCLAGPYFIFDVDDEFAFDIDETVTVELLFDRTQTEGFIISYDHAVDTPVSRTIVFDAAKQTRWQRETITLERAGFANRRHGQTDLGVAALGAVLPYDAGADHELVLCDMKIERPARPPMASRPAGTLDLTIRDSATGTPTAARVGFYDAAGRLPRPGDEALTVRRFNDDVKELPLRRGFEFWPVEGRYAFYVSGAYEAQVPADSYELVVSKGPEYRIRRQRFEVGADRKTKVDVALERWMDMPAKGWYSGDSHIHIERSRKANSSI